LINVLLEKKKIVLRVLKITFSFVYFHPIILLFDFGLT